MERLRRGHRSRSQIQTGTLILNPLHERAPTRLVKPGHLEMAQTCSVKLQHLVQQRRTG